MKVMYRLYDSSDSTILPEDFYKRDVPILRFYLRIFPIIIHRFYDSSDSTILPEDGYERDVPILRFL